MEMQTPNTPWSSSRPRRNRPPSMLSPSFSRTAFPAPAPASAAVTAAGAGAVTEHPCVTLLEWWLERLEGDDQKVAVAGVFERNQTIEEFDPSPIAKRHEPCVLETENGVVLHICGSLNISRMRSNGYSSKVCEMFIIGFPQWWESCNLLYPKETSSHTGCQPTPSNTSKSEEDSAQFYLEKFQLGQRIHSYGSSLLSKLLDSAQSCSRKNRVNSFSDSTFENSSCLSDGTPRFEEYTSDGDIATNENAAATHDDGERHEAVCNEVDNLETHLTSGRALRERNDDDIDTNASLLHTVECANDADNEEAHKAPPTSTCDQRTPVVLLKTQGSRKKTQHITPSKKAAVDEEMPNCVDNIPTNEDAAASNDGGGERDEVLCNKVDNVEIDLTAGTLGERDNGGVDTNASLVLTVECANNAGNEESDNALPTSERGHDDIITNVSLAPIVECTNDDVNEGVDNVSLLGCKKTPVVSLKSRGCQEKCQHTPSNVKIPVHTKELFGTDCLAYSQIKQNCPNGRIQQQLISQQIPGLNSLESAFHQLLHKRVSARSQAMPKKAKPSGPPKKQKSALDRSQGPKRSPLTSPVAYAHDSPLTRSRRATPLPMSTPEALKLKRTRSGRVVVPSLDAGCQRIVYDIDGTITGVIGLDSPPPKDSKLKTYTRKKRMADLDSPPPAKGSELKTYARRKKSRAA